MTDAVFSEAVKSSFYRAVDDFDMLNGRKRILVGFSGGCDSSVLLSLLKKETENLGICVAALHVNHGIRGDEADRDEEFCRGFCQRLGIPLTVRKTDVPALASALGIGTEEAARKERYRIFTEEASAGAFDAVAVAHHADDNLETVVFNLLRGASLHGLGGIPPVRTLSLSEENSSQITLIRPLIFCTRAELVGYAEENGIGYVADSSNGDTAYTRNYIRSVLPGLCERINPSAAKKVAESCRGLRDDEQFIRDRCAEYRGELSEAPLPILSRSLADAYIRSGGPSSELTHAHVEALVELCQSGKLWSTVCLPGKIRAVKTREGIAFEAEATEKTENGNEPDPEPWSLPLVPGKNVLPGDYVIAVGESVSAPLTITADAISFLTGNGSELYARNRRPGDRIFTHGMHKSVKKLLSDTGLSPEERNKLPFLCDKDGIFWIPGAAVRDGFYEKNGILYRKEK